MPRRMTVHVFHIHFPAFMQCYTGVVEDAIAMATTVLTGKCTRHTVGFHSLSHFLFFCKSSIYVQCICFCSCCTCSGVKVCSLFSHCALQPITWLQYWKCEFQYELWWRTAHENLLFPYCISWLIAVCNAQLGLEPLKPVCVWKGLHSWWDVGQLVRHFTSLTL